MFCVADREEAGRFRVERGAVVELFGLAWIFKPCSAALFVARWLLFRIRADRRRRDGDVNEVEVLTIVCNENGIDSSIERLCSASMGEFMCLAGRVHGR